MEDRVAYLFLFEITGANSIPQLSPPMIRSPAGQVASSEIRIGQTEP